MLVISRCEGELFYIDTPNGETIAIQLVRFVNGNKVRIGITAPSEYKIHRHDIVSREEKNRENTL